jgi:NCS1 family nucleobase:cation symporter-1
VAAIFIADYYVHKQKRIDVASLYNGDKGRYWYKGGWNLAAVIAWIGAFIIPLLGNTVFLYNPASGAPGFLDWLAANGYIVSFAIGFFLYILLMSKETKSKVSEEEHEALTDRQTA